MTDTFCAYWRCVELVDDDISEYCIMHQPDNEELEEKEF